MANRSRLEGDWVGTIGRLTIAMHGSAIGAVHFLLVDGRLTEFRGDPRASIGADGVIDGKRLYLTRTSPTQGGGFNLATMRLELSADGDSLTGLFRSSEGHTGAVSLKKSRP